MSAAKRLMGFAKMDKAKVKEIASKGGKRVHELGRSRQWTAEEAKVAGSRGGKVSRGGRRSVLDNQEGDQE